MVEKNFVDSLIKTLEARFGDKGVVLRSSDRYTLGIPDIMCFCYMAPAIAIEAKQIQPLMPDPFRKGRRIGQMLEHPFMGPQISMLRRLKATGVDAFGLVRASLDTAFRINPSDLPAKTGNFTHEELVKIGRPIQRREGLWRFWEHEDDQVPSSGYRDDPRD
jgi:hypothetical protein